jgi:hypothetical protein
MSEGRERATEGGWSLTAEKRIERKAAIVGDSRVFTSA